MSATLDRSTTDQPEPTECETAEEFARRALEGAESPVTAADLANEYGCSAGHMRRTLRELTRNGLAVRVNRGEYLPPEEANEPKDGEARYKPTAAELNALGRLRERELSGW